MIIKIEIKYFLTFLSCSNAICQETLTISGMVNSLWLDQKRSMIFTRQSNTVFGQVLDLTTSNSIKNFRTWMVRFTFCSLVFKPITFAVWLKCWLRMSLIWNSLIGVKSVSGEVWWWSNGFTWLMLVLTWLLIWNKITKEFKIVFSTSKMVKNWLWIMHWKWFTTTTKIRKF